MQIHQIKPIHKSKDKKRIGRGGKRGTYSGRGIKGQKARAGHKLEKISKKIIKKFPKLRGYKYKGFQNELAVLNVEDLEKNFQAKEKVTPKTLVKKGLVKKVFGRIPEIKILGKGEITKPFFVENCKVSALAKAKILMAKGSVKEK